MRIVGLTGGIASGKSTVASYFKANALPVVDADLVARGALNKGTGGHRKVVEAFGEDILLHNGEVNRAKLGQVVFSDPDKRLLLNRLLSPYIRMGILWGVFKLWFRGERVIVLDVPLLFEAKMNKWTNPVIVVWVCGETQLRRLISRDGISENEAQNRIRSQLSLDLKMEKADIIIDNSGSLHDLNRQLSRVFSEITKPLTWTEFGLSRMGAIISFVGITVSVLVVRHFLKG